MSGKTRQIVGSILTIVGYATTEWGVGYVLIGIGAALSYDGAKRIQREAELRARAGARQSSIKGNVRSSYPQHFLVFGKARVGASAVCTTGTEDGADLPAEYLYLGLEHSAVHSGGCEGLTGNLWLDDTFVPAASLTGDPNTTTASVTAGIFNGLVSLRHYKGTGTQVADATLVGLGFDSATDYRRGIAWTWFKLKRTPDDELFRNAFKYGIPTINVEFKGIKCYDPRLDSTNGGAGTQRLNDETTWTWTDNAILQAATYAMMKVSDGGYGRPASGIDWPSVAAAANICEEAKSTPAGNRNRFVGNGVLSTQDNREVNLQKLLDACMGRKVTVGGKWKFYAACYSTPAFAIDETWLAGPIKIVTRSPIESLYNAVRINFDDEGNDYKTTDAPPLTSATYESQDGGYRVWQDLNLPMVSNGYDAQYLGQIHHKRGRFQMQVQLLLNFKALDIETWQTGTLNFPNSKVNSYLSGKVFRIIDWRPTKAGFEVDLQQDDSSVYTVDAMTVPSGGTAASVGTEKPPQVTGVQAFGMPDGIVLTFTAPASHLVERVQVERAAASGGPYSVVGYSAKGTTVFIDRDAAGGTWWYRLAGRTERGNLGDYSTPVSATAKQAADSGAITVVNGDFEGGDTGWTKDAGWAIVNDPANAYYGSWEAQFTGASAGKLTNVKRLPVAPGDQVIGIGFIKNTLGAAGSASVRLSFLDSSGAEIGAGTGTLTNQTTYGQSRIAMAAPASSAFVVLQFSCPAPGAGKTYYCDQGLLLVAPKNLDEVPDSSTYGRTVQTALTSGQPDLSKSGVINKTLDNVADTATYGRTTQTALTSGQPDLSKAGVINKTLDNVADTGTYGRTKQTALTSGQPDLSKAGVINKTLDYVSDGAAAGGRRAQRVHPFVDNGGAAAWILLGTWVGGNQARGFTLRVFNGVGYNSAGNQQSYTEIIVRGSNGAAAPNLSGIVYFTRGTAAVTGVKAVATGGSTAAANLSWDIYVSVSAYAKGTYTVDMAVDDSWAHAGSISADPGSASTTVVVGDGDVMADYQGRQDWGRSKVINKTLDNVADTASYARTSAARVSSGKPLIDFSEAIHLNKNVDNIPDGATYGRPVLAALTTGQPDLSKAGVINKTLDNVADTASYARTSASRVSSGKPLIDFSEAIHLNKNVDNVPDGSTYGRPVLAALTSGQPDLSKSGVINKTLDQIADTATYARPKAAAVIGSNLGGITGYGKFYQYIDALSTPGSGSITIPYGASILTIRAWGPGGSGSKGTGLGTGTAGGGGGGALKKTVLIQNADWGQTISFSVGTPGPSQTTSGSNGTAGTATTVTSSGLSFTNLALTANGGAGGNGTGLVGGAGGTASGGDTNVTGSAGGTNVSGPSAGGNSATIDSIFGPGATTAQTDGKAPGGGGGGKPNANSGAGGAGLIQFIWS